ncbi:protein DOWNY MILDEW RESISTANCE 6-like [Diospyros lotus]|uniref:protein DOWNY MILDEW RESISTANCE 6-like n=1 Tax=Diospyros lotus TaxID=55363 RepID=UPI0022590A4B|nr:protein DOWNY MILDEW RESISTANCE 6-like isoform X1 [Diospyros lotus]XP_052184853.1 protein DOWNY MILDEW RESISTANCE 6-like isoform X2 [Diospyros lotus]XP_052184858.1 protein DOWNY MILDEW RESISTANCE 6-like [Diospyros lotus]
MDVKLISTGIQYSSLPESYKRPESERPKLSEVEDCENVPIIDLDCENRSLVVQQIGEACRDYGFFQVINHGVEKEAVEKMVEAAKEFFSLPVEEKMKLYSDEPSKKVRLSTSFNVKKEKVHNWRDYLRLHCFPLDQYLPQWPSNPPSFRDAASTYCMEVRKFGLRLEEAISESLGLQKAHIETVLGQQGQHMAVNFYPPCPQPELTYGLPAHTDPNTFTILLQDLHVSGLQVLHNGKWCTVKPLPDAFVVNIGDQLQALSNGRYRSVWHRAIVNAEKPRMSVASFLCPADDALISPLEELTGDGIGVVYRDFTYAEYYKKFWSRNLDQEHCLELFKN